MSDTGTFDDLGISFLGFVATILGEEEIKRLTIAIARLLPEGLDLSLSRLLRGNILDIESLLSLSHLEEMSSLCLLCYETRTLPLES